MSYFFLKIRKFLAFFILRSLIKKIKISKKVEKNVSLLNITRDIDKCIRKIDSDLSKKQEFLVLCSSKFNGSLEFSNVFLNRLSKDIKKRIRHLEINEYLSLDLTPEKDSEDGNFKSL